MEQRLIGSRWETATRNKTTRIIVCASATEQSTDLLHKVLLRLLVGSLRGTIVARTRKPPHDLGVYFTAAFKMILDQVVDSLANEGSQNGRKGEIEQRERASEREIAVARQEKRDRRDR